MPPLPATLAGPNGCSFDKTLASAQPTTEANYTRVVMADYPSTGSSWLRHMLSELASRAGVANPTCSIYPEGGCSWYADDEQTTATRLDCKPSLRSYDERSGGECLMPPTALVKSHFPAQELQHGVAVDSTYQFSRTMRLDKLVLLARNPLDTLRSNRERWGANVEDNLACWAAWWAPVASALAAQGKLLVLRYEELCEDTAGSLVALLKFLGSPYDSWGEKDVEAMLSDNAELRCLHAGEAPTTPEDDYDAALYDKCWNDAFRGLNVTYEPPATGARLIGRRGGEEPTGLLPRQLRGQLLHGVGDTDSVHPRDNYVVFRRSRNTWLPVPSSGGTSHRD